MPDRAFVLNPQYTVAIVDDAHALITDPDGAFSVLKGETVTAVLRASGHQPFTWRSLTHTLFNVDPEDLLALTERLVQHDILRPVLPPEAAPDAPVGHGLPASATLAALPSTPPVLDLGVLGSASAGDTPGLPPAFEAALLQALPEGGEGGAASPPVLVLAPDPFHPLLATVNRHARRVQQRWLLVVPEGEHPTVGPCFAPSGFCYRCLVERLLYNRPAQQYLMAHPPSSVLRPPPRHRPEAQAWVQQELAAFYAIAAGRGEGQGIHALADHLLRYSDGGSPTLHRVVRWPSCPTCGAPAPGPPSPPKLEPRPRGALAENGYRTVDAATAYRRYAHLLDPHTGYVKHLKRLDLGDPSLLAYSVAHPMHYRADTLPLLRMVHQGRSYGKGATVAQARASCLFEGLERVAFLFQGHEYRIRATCTRLSDQALHPHDLLGFSDAQYAGREAWNAAHPDAPMLFIPHPFDPDVPIEWVPVWSITERRFKYVPAAYVFFGYPRQDRPFCFADSNGNAAALTLEEAFLQGLLEVIERDAAALWFYPQAQRRAVDIAAFGQPYADALLAHYHDVLGRTLRVLDLTSDTGIPCFVALSGRRQAEPQDIIMGFGCHLDPVVALMRALTEVNQSLYRVMLHNADGSTAYRDRDPELLRWFQTATFENQPCLTPAPHHPPCTPADYPRRASEDVTQDLRRTIDSVLALGLDVLLYDATRPDIGVSTVKVIVPGMVHYWRRLGAPRMLAALRKSSHPSNPYAIMI